MWTPLRFGKHKGKTLPEVICSDPSYFMWAVHKRIFLDKIAREAETLHRRLRGVIAPKQHPDRWDAYGYQRSFSSVSVRRKLPAPAVYGPQSDHLNIDMVHVTHPDEWRDFLRSFRKILFDGEKMTKRRSEAFFSDESNFIDP